MCIIIMIGGMICVLDSNLTVAMVLFAANKVLGWDYGPLPFILDLKQHRNMSFFQL